MTRFVTSVLLFSLLSPPSLRSQDCQDCKPRILILFDNQVGIPRPYANKDSIYTYWDYFFIAGGVKDYVINTDPSAGCLVKLDGAFFTKKDTVSSSITYGMEHANTPPSGQVPGYADYVIYGTVDGQPTHVLTLRIEASGSRELVKSAQVSFADHFDPFVIGNTAAAQLSPIYTTIMNFEKKKRDGGEPYAIQPKIEFTPQKAKIDVNETTSVDIFMYDCDGVPLKNRNLALTADGGTLSNGSVTTDDQGKATVQFTAGSQPALGNVTTTYPFTHGNGYQDAADVQPASIQIKKPDDSWYVTANYSVDNTHTDDQTTSSSVASSYDSDHTNIVFSAWVKNISPLQNIFSGDPTTAVVVYSGNYKERMHYRYHWEVPSAFIDENKYTVKNAASTKATVPKLTTSIANRTYNFGISNITASQTGGGNDITVSCDPTGVPKTTTSTSNADPKLILSLAAADANHDTTYTTTQSSSVSGLTTVTSTHL